MRTSRFRFAVLSITWLVMLLSALSMNGVKADAQHKSLPRSAPEEQGISSSDLLAFIETADSQIDTLHSFMLVRHGHVVAEGWWGPYDRATPHILYSLSKSFTS